jgi:hypothetical protein
MLAMGWLPRAAWHGRDVHAISHINVVVDDIEVATEFYRTVLGSSRR